MRPPGPQDGWEAWNAFHAALSLELHTHPDLLTACGRHGYEDVPADWRQSPWTTGACGIAARAIYEWIDQPRRALWMVLGRRVAQSAMQRYWSGYDTDEDVPRHTYPHAIVRYRSDKVGFVYFDGVTITGDDDRLLQQFNADDVLTRSRRANDYMAEAYRFDPFDDRRVELVKQVLVNAFGRWPKR